MSINTIHRAEMLDLLKSTASEKQQSIRLARQDSIAEASDAQAKIANIRRTEKNENFQMYFDNIQRQRDRMNQLNQGLESYAESRAKILSLRRKESQQAQNVSKFTKLKKQYIALKAQEVKQQQVEAQNRQSEITVKAREMLNNILPFRQKQISEFDRLNKVTV
jgi:hypothetical protein